ncbi:MAG: hypothetical protein IID41_05025 [Planctomycetes bacterium]|nr:hypothetical protein [Planctomycetota bacterium]
MARPNLPKKLLVEGEEDKRVIPQLIEANGIRWGENPDTWIVEIDQCDGFEKMVKQGLIETELKTSGLEVLGIIADANDKAEERWESLRNRCREFFPQLPDELPATGLIHTSETGLKLGVWLMPDNRSHGMMETFLTYLVPDDRNSVLKYAESARDQARALGAPYKDVHADKAKIHTWLAWQDPPGQQLHSAVMQHLLDPCSPHAAAFVKWFRSLFGI